MSGFLRLFRSAHARLSESEHVYMVLLALIVGIGGGLFAVAFRHLIGLGNSISWQNATYTLDYIRDLPAWWKIIVPAIGGLICGLIIFYLAREAKGHGVPEVMEAVALRGGRIRPRVVIAKMVASAISIASGGSVGREGPIVQIGSALGSSIGQWLRVDERRLRTLVGCGAAAGIAGTFNAPVAGALFAVEIILSDFRVTQFSPIVISSVAGTVVAHFFLGDDPAFIVPAYQLVNTAELFAYALLGVLAGLAALVFVRLLYLSEDLFDAVPVWPPMKALVGGAVVGVIALWFPEVFGVGYEAIGEALNGNMVWHLLLALVGVKILAVSITIGSGGSGGIFAPSLFIGAMVGGTVGTIITAIWPGATAGPGAYALVGMAAVVGATTHAPITAIVIIFELTSDYGIMLPLMISCTIATLLASSLQHASIYTMKLLRRGVDIYKGHDISVLKHLAVRDAMRRDFVTVPPGAQPMQLIAKFISHPGTSIFVIDDDQNLLGVITANEARPVLNDTASYEAFLIASDLMRTYDCPTVSPDDTLAEVMKRLARYRGEVPVVEGRKLVGVIWPEDVIDRYNTEVFKRDMASGMAATVATPNREVIPTVEGTAFAEVLVPLTFVDKTLGSLDVRNRYGVTVLLIKDRTPDGEEMVHAANPAHTFKVGDILLVMGPNDAIKRLERGAVEYSTTH